MTVLIKHANLVRKAEIQELMDSVHKMGTPITESSHAEVVPAAPVALVIFLIVVMIRGHAKPGVPIHSAGDRLLGRHLVHPLRIEAVPTA